MSQLTKVVKKEASFWQKAILLLGFRQTYLFSKNVWGMIEHPHLTTAKILAKRDLSQAFLVFGLPFSLWLIFSFFVFSIWFFLRPSGIFFILGFVFFILVGLFLLLIALYDLYWIYKYFKGSKKLSR